MCMVEDGESVLYTEIPVPVGAKCNDCGAADPIEGRRWIMAASGCILLIDDEPRAWHKGDAPLEGDWHYLHDWLIENDEPPPDFVPASALDDTTSFRCGRCKEASRWLTEVCQGYLWDAVREDIIEHWDEDHLYRNHAFGRLVIAAKNSWWDRARTLMTVDRVKTLVDNALAKVDAADAGIPKNQGATP